MARDISRRLENLRQRRNGIGPEMDSQRLREALAKALDGEAWQRRSTGAPNTQYALGAMQEVDSTYTRISIETGLRVTEQLVQGFRRRGETVETRFQGSMPLNVHIRGYSDVDVLLISTLMLTYDGRVARPGAYQPTSETSEGTLRNLRQNARQILESSYPKAEVDNTGGKAIKISGASLPRSVDVVPAHWWDTADYQTSKDEAYRGVVILDAKSQTTFDNLPFLHILLVNLGDHSSGGGLKKAVRLCKNVRAEANADGKNIVLSSFDITALMYHADHKELARGSTHELAILAEAQRYLQFLSGNYSEARKLMVPDGTRAVIDSPEKFTSLVTLSIELNELANEVAAEQTGGIRFMSAPRDFAIRDVLKRAVIG